MGSFFYLPISHTLNYKQTIAYIFSKLPMYQRIGSAAYKSDLINTLAIDTLLKHPHRHFKTIHIAGTNGKGSVSHLLASVLQEAGYKTGLYTSPHLKDFRERIRINGKKTDSHYIARFITKYQHHFEVINPSFFEMTVGLAFNYFKDESVDIAVIETGLGGRLDSTNIITPELSVITNIGLDHTYLLGPAKADIASEKAGIIKKNIPVVIGETQNETVSIFNKKATQEEAPISYADKCFELNDFKPHPVKRGLITASITDQKNNKQYIYNCPLTGYYQRKNIVTVLCSIQQLRLKGLKISEKAVTDGFEKVIKNTHFMGRWQILSRKPLTVCDTGHNEDGIKEITAQLRNTPFLKLHFVIGMVNDKDRSSILGLLPKDAIYYFCRPDIPRGLDAHILKADANKYGLKGTVYSTVSEAFKEARHHADEKDLIFAGGSTFVVAEVLQYKK